MTNENDENGTGRITRAKAAALSVPADNPAGFTKKPLQAKKGATNTQIGLETVTGRKRTALGDVSNMNKAEIIDAKDVKKALSTVTGAIAKAAQPTGIQKASRTSSSRSTLSAKDKNASVNDLKRPASAASVASTIPKKRTSTSDSIRRSIKDESVNIENVEPAVNGETVQVKISQSVKVVKRTADGQEVESEVRRDEKVISAKRLKTEEEVKLAKRIEEMDEEDGDDPLMVSEYVYEILEYMKELEGRTRPNPMYMSQQKDIDWKMRGILVDWLLEVHTRFSLLPETFYLTVNIIDRFLTSKVIQLERLQLVGVTAMFIASKYEEVLSPHIGNFRHVADDGFSEAEILNAEKYMLQTLDYDLSFPNPMHFMRRISKADQYDIQTRTLAKFILEISLFDHRLLNFPPSINAAASMYLARNILQKGTWVSGIHANLQGHC